MVVELMMDGRVKNPTALLTPGSFLPVCNPYLEEFESTIKRTQMSTKEFH
jgi:hypothetical protein